MASELKKYSIVKLYCNTLERTVYPVVPTNWLNEEQECFYPENLKLTKNLESQVRKCLDPDSLWPTFPVIVLSSCGT